MAKSRIKLVAPSIRTDGCSGKVHPALAGGVSREVMVAAVIMVEGVIMAAADFIGVFIIVAGKSSRSVVL